MNPAASPYFSQRSIARWFQSASWLLFATGGARRSPICHKGGSTSSRSDASAPTDREAVRACSRAAAVRDLREIRARQTGSTLIEVMVTVLILSTSLLGMAALQNRSLQYSHSAYLRSQANILAYDILDRIRINRDNINSYRLELGAKPPTGDGLEQSDLREWREMTAAALPDGDSAILCEESSRTCAVTIQWAEQNSSGEESEDTSTFEYTTKI